MSVSITEAIDNLGTYVHLAILLNVRIDIEDGNLSIVDKIEELKKRPELIVVNGKYKIDLEKYPEYGL